MIVYQEILLVRMLAWGSASLFLSACEADRNKVPAGAEVSDGAESPIASIAGDDESTENHAFKQEIEQFLKSEGILEGQILFMKQSSGGLITVTMGQPPSLDYGAEVMMTKVDGSWKVVNRSSWVR
jgi:hypothetical protein